jgi:hypothetical protein
VVVAHTPHWMDIKRSSPLTPDSDSHSAYSSDSEYSGTFYSPDCHLGMGSWNVDGVAVTTVWIQALYARWSTKPNLHVLYLVDTRLDPAKKDLYKHLFLTNLGGGFSVYLFPGQASGVKGRNNHVGGITMLVRHQRACGWSVSKLHYDPSGCGIYLGADMHHTSGRRVRVVGAYLPMAVGDPAFGNTLGTPAQEATLLASSLARKVRTYMASRPGLRRFPTAAAWFWHRMQLFLESTEWEVIIAGDFNMSWPAPGPIRLAPSPFQKLTADMGLSNQAAEAIRSVGGTYLSTCRPDYSMAADRDHILSTLPPGSLRAAAILSDPVWTAGRNHAPIWAGYRIPVTKAPSKGADGSPYSDGDQEDRQHTDAEIVVEDDPMV